MLRDINLALFLPELFPDVGRVHLVRLLDVRAQVGAAHVGRVAHWEGADVWPLAGVRPDVVLEVLLARELLRAVRALEHALAGAPTLAHWKKSCVKGQSLILTHFPYMNRTQHLV